MTARQPTGDKALLSGSQYPAYPALNVAMTYDSYGRTSAMANGQGSHGYAYDDNDALTNETTTYTGVPASEPSVDG